MLFQDVYYLPSGRIFLLKSSDGYLVEATEMRDVSVDGKENEIVRESNNPRVIWSHLKPYSEKWLLTVSTQKGCVHNCKFCDVANLPFEGNLNINDIMQQIKYILRYTPYVKKSNKVKIGFARMGEPAHNLDKVLFCMRILKTEFPNFNWLPCFNSILPRNTIEKKTGFQVISDVLDVKENDYNGFLHFQISCNSTNEEQRKNLFGGADVLSISEIITFINDKKITNRTVTLNFIVMKDIEIDISYLMKLGLNPEKFTVKLIPMNETNASKENKLKTYANYSNYEKLKELENEFKKYNIPVVMDAIAKCEEAGLCCGQLAQIFMTNAD